MSAKQNLNNESSIFSVCIFTPLCKNTDALLCIHFLGLYKGFCLATIGAMYFSCVSFGWRIFYFVNLYKNTGKFLFCKLNLWRNII